VSEIGSESVAESDPTCHQARPVFGGLVSTVAYSQDYSKILANLDAIGVMVRAEVVTNPYSRKTQRLLDYFSISLTSPFYPCKRNYLCLSLSCVSMSFDWYRIEFTSD
jgi:hypothetical protein